MRALAVTGDNRTRGAPEVPTLQEAGVPGYEASVWGGIVVSAGTPRPVVDQLSQSLARILSQPAVQETFRAQGAEAAYSSPDAFGKLIASEIPKWRSVMKSAHLAPDEL